MGATMGKSGGGGGGSLFDSINPSSQTLHIVQLGLDSAGKTTVLYRLKFDQYLNTVPTIGFNCEKIRGTGKAKGVQFLVWDVGGQEKLRPLWRSYTRCTDGIVFVLDSVDVERMEEAKIELMRTANSNVVSRADCWVGLRDRWQREMMLILAPFVVCVLLGSTCIGAGQQTGPAWRQGSPRDREVAGTERIDAAAAIARISDPTAHQLIAAAGDQWP